MRRLQTIIVALLLVVAMACNAPKVERIPLTDSTIAEQTSSEDIATLPGDDATFEQPDGAVVPPVVEK